jgi:hypothetical protein
MWLNKRSATRIQKMGHKNAPGAEIKSIAIEATVGLCFSWAYHHLRVPPAAATDVAGMGGSFK